MASPVVVTRSTPSAVTTAGTSHTVNLPGSLVAGNRLGVIFVGLDPNAHPSGSARGRRLRAQPGQSAVGVGGGGAERCVVDRGNGDRGGSMHRDRGACLLHDPT